MLTLKQKIKIELAKQDRTGGDVARAIGIDRSTFWWTVYGRLKNPKVREAICEFLNLPMSVWDKEDRVKKAA